MKIVFLSTFALDANVSLINALGKTCDVYFFTEALYEIYNFIDKDKLTRTVSTGTDVEELQRFKNFIPLEKTFVVKGTRNGNVLKKLYISYVVNQLIRKINPDIILIDNYMLTYFLSTLSFRKKMMMIVHDPFLHSGENFIIDRFLRKLHFKLINHKILLNENQKEDFIEQYRQKKENIHSSFLSVYDYLQYYKTDNANSASGFNILFFGRISPYKGIKFLLDAFVEILVDEKYEDMSLTIAGGGTFDFDIEIYRQYPQIKILNEYIYPEKLANYISQASVVVCPYTDATQSGVIMSAYAFKKPVIATNVGGLPEMVEDGKTGIIIEPKSSKAIINAILKLYMNKDILKEMSQNISGRYHNGEKSWDSSASQFLSAINKITK